MRPSKSERFYGALWGVMRGLLGELKSVLEGPFIVVGGMGVLARTGVKVA